MDKKKILGIVVDCVVEGLVWYTSHWVFYHFVVEPKMIDEGVRVRKLECQQEYVEQRLDELDDEIQDLYDLERKKLKSEDDLKHYLED